MEQPMNATKIQKWGNSMALRIPAPMLRALGIAEGQTLALAIENGALVARPAQQRYTLAELIAQCDVKKRVSKQEREWLDAAPVGLEEI
jgi:antitoxin ChpS